MSTVKRRAPFFSSLELEILMRSYGDFEHVFRKKSNTAAAAKERETAWEKIAARVNACNPAGEKRTWQQLKMKYKNIVQTANRKKADVRRQNIGRPAAKGIPGGSSSSESTPQDTKAFIKYSDGAICLPATIDLVTDEEDEETVSAPFTEGDPEKPIELTVKEIYKIHLLRKIQKNDKEMLYLDRQIRKTDLEIEILEHQLEEIKKTK